VRVVLDGRAAGGDGGGGQAATAAPAHEGWHLVVHDDGMPLGNGQFGAVFLGTASFAGREVRVAVKKFFFLEQPRLYSLADAGAVASAVQHVLLPEVNTLLGLAHRNVVRLRCVGLGNVYSVAFPVYVAMDFCSDGTLARWIEQRRLTDVVIVAFLSDLVDAMVYVLV
jgi:serine/threonine protein kinase